MQTGDLQRAQTVLDGPLSLQGPEMQGMLTDALRVRAMLLRSRGDLAGAGTVLDELLSLTRSMPYPFAEAQVLTEYACLETARNRAEAARERLTEAMDLFRRLGAQPFVEETEETLARSVP
jgi:hypothetical protein